MMNEWLDDGMKNASNIAMEMMDEDGWNDERMT